MVWSEIGKYGAYVLSWPYWMPKVRMVGESMSYSCGELYADPYEEFGI